MRLGSILPRSQSRRTRSSSSATDNASPAPTRRAERRQAISGACLEALEGRRLMSFSPAVSYPAGESPQEVVTGDFNNDGTLDLVTANIGDNTLSALLGNGDGTFQPAKTSPTGIPAGIWQQSLAVGDFNDDGMLDVASGNNDYYHNYYGGTGGDGVSILLGNGDGTFKPDVPLPGYGGWWFVATGDLNGDNKVDIVVTSNRAAGSMGGTGVYVLLGRGDGTFAYVPAPQQSSYGPESYYTPVLADFNRDGKMDVGVPTGWGFEALVKVYLGNGDGTLARPRDVVTSSSANQYAETMAVTVGDFNGDSRLDLVTRNSNNSESLVLGNGDGTFQAWQSIAAWGAAGDVNGDGALDLVLGAGAFLGHGDGSFATWVGGAGSSAVLADFNADGRLDAAGPDGSGGLSVSINDGNWSFPPPAVSVSDATVTEGNTGTVNATFTLTLSHASDVDVTVHYATADITATAGGDYTAASGAVTIPAGQTSRTFTVAVNGDRLAEPSETFSVNLIDSTNATIRDGQGIGTILDNEPRVSINNVNKKEGNGGTTPFTFTVRLSAAYDQAVTVNYATASGTATAGTDYLSKTGALTFAPGETSKTISVAVKGDKQKEPNEAFFLDLSGASSNALIGLARGIGTILNDD
jgi:hypothetical protein